MFEGLTTRAGWALFHPTLPVLCAGDGKVPSGSVSGLDPDSMGSLAGWLDVLFWGLKAFPVALDITKLQFLINKRHKKISSCIFFCSFWSSNPWIRVGSVSWFVTGFTWNTGSGSGSTALVFPRSGSTWTWLSRIRIQQQWNEKIKVKLFASYQCWMRIRIQRYGSTTLLETKYSSSTIKVWNIGMHCT